MIGRVVVCLAACLWIATCCPRRFELERVGEPAPAAVPELEGVTRVTDLGIFGSAAAPSPDGKLLAYQAGERGERDIWVAEPDGSDARQLTDDADDDREPAWTRDGKHIVWSSNRDGSYDLWMMTADGKEPRKVVALSGQETQPQVSSLEYELFAVTPNSCSDEGASGRRLDAYQKVAFTREYQGRQEIWFASLNGKHQGRLSEEGKRCHSPAWSGNGLSLTWTCGDAASPVVLDGRAQWDQSFSAALKAVGAVSEDEPAKGACEDVPDEAWDEDDCTKGLPRRYAEYPSSQASAPAAQLSEGVYSANQTVLLARSREGVLHHRVRGGEAPWRELRFGEMKTRQPVWSPDGESVYFESRHEGHLAIYRAETDFYLQEVRDLVDYPELWGEGQSKRLHQNRFVARPGDEKEFYTRYEKLRYQRRAPFVTADAALQIFHDEFTNLLQAAEAEAQDLLLALSTKLFERYSKKGRGKVGQYLAVHAAVPMVLLQAAGEILLGKDEAEGMGDPDAPPEKLDAIAIIRKGVGAQVAKLPKKLQPEVNRHVDDILAHDSMEDFTVPGMPDPVKLDYTLFQVRGHYAASRLAGYFLAMTWYAVAPLPMDKQVFELVRQLEALKDDQGKSLYDLWVKVSSMVGAFMGRPVDATIEHLKELAAKQPALTRRFKADVVARELEKLRGPVAVRGAEGALSGSNKYGLKIALFPKRVGLDVEVFKALTHPDVELRGFPSSLDVMAALQVPAARKHAVAAAQAAKLHEAYQAALDKTVERTKGLPAGYWSTDIYHSWLAMLATLAKSAPSDAPEAARRMPFLTNDAWLDRLLHSSLAGFTQLKHAAVLYAFQDYSMECDSMTAYAVLTEQPVLPEPRGFVEPAPEFFAAMVALAEVVYERMAGGKPPELESELYDARGRDLPNPKNARGFALRLKELALKQVRGEALSEEEYHWINSVGAVIEALFLGQQKPNAIGYAADEGRLERGVALVADIHTNLTRNEVLELGIGRLLDLYVVVGDDVGQRMTQGAALSFYEFTHPMSDRLSDQKWGEMVKAGKLPPPPEWTKSFLEPRPK